MPLVVEGGCCLGVVGDEVLLAVVIAGVVAALSSPRGASVQVRTRRAVAAAAIALTAALPLLGVNLLVHLFPWVVLLIAVTVGWFAPALFYERRRR